MLKCKKCGLVVDEKTFKINVGYSIITKEPEDKDKIIVRVKNKPIFNVFCKKDGNLMEPLVVLLH